MGISKNKKVTSQMTFTPRVIDIYHGDDVSPQGFVQAQKNGIWAVIHKATQGSSIRDKKYKERKKQALDVGLLWGAYHFNDGSKVEDQVKNFLDMAEPDPYTVLVLDYEDYSSNMDIHDAVKFMKLIEQKTNKPCSIYSGNRLKENIIKLSDADQKYMTSKKLWICQYGPTVKLPKGFDKYWLWQYTGDGVGPLPHGLPYFSSGYLDLNVYDGTLESLKKEWYEMLKGPRILKDGVVYEN
jgi:lysozyme